MGDLPDFERRQIVGPCLAGASVTKAVTLSDVSRAIDSKVMPAHKNYGKTISAKRNSGQKSIVRKRSSYDEKDCLKNHTTTASQMAKQNQTPWPVVRKGTIPIERPPLVG
jgi:hypothetical protein